jgi:hypothetical protein
MDPQDHLHALLDGVGCTVCEEPVPAARIQLLARRDDLAFVQVDCFACGSSSLGFVIAGGLPAEALRFADAPPISGDDVLDMHQLLDGWRGDLSHLLGEGTRRSPSGGADALR